MGDIVTFTQAGGRQRTWVPRADEEWWIQWWGRQGVPAARWRDYLRWDGFYPPVNGIRASIMLRPVPRSRRTYRRFTVP